MEGFFLILILFLPLIVASIIWWFRAAGGIVRAANALERIADAMESQPEQRPQAARVKPQPPPVLTWPDDLPTTTGQR